MDLHQNIWQASNSNRSIASSPKDQECQFSWPF